jgi:hypothetical protein
MIHYRLVVLTDVSQGQGGMARVADATLPT